MSLLDDVIGETSRIGATHRELPNLARRPGPRRPPTRRPCLVSEAARRADLPGCRPRPVRLSRERACHHLCLGRHRGRWRGLGQSPLEGCRSHSLEERGFENRCMVHRGGRSAGRPYVPIRAASAPRRVAIPADLDGNGASNRHSTDPVRGLENCLNRPTIWLHACTRSARKGPTLRRLACQTSIGGKRHDALPGCRVQSTSAL